MTTKRIIILFLSLQLIHAQTFAQSSNSNAFLDYSERPQGPADYIVKRFPNQKLISARLVSGVGRPGFYQIPENTSLLSLVSYSGGFRDTADIEEVTIWRQSTKQSLSFNLKNALEGTDVADPIVKPEDVIYIKERPKLADTVTLVAVISTTVAAILGAIAIHDRVTNYKP
jgi:hypothetical protein